jgi:diguanylate cyclase (GGDEF)-like protein/PAS domain S-box-containing protein
MQIQTDPLSVLIVDDDAEEYRHTHELLCSQDRARFTIEWCQDFDEALVAIGEQRHDVYLIDYQLGERTGLDLVRRAFTPGSLAPVLILTDEANYEIDLEATAAGVTDFLLKADLAPLSLERTIRYAVSQQRAIHDFAHSEERYALAVRASNDGVWDWDLGSDEMYFSPRWHTILGKPENDERCDPSTWFDLVHPDDLLRLRAAIDAHLAGHTPHLESEHRMRHSDGSWRWMLTRGLAIRGVDGQATRMAGSMSDVTDRRRAERQIEYDALHDTLTGLPNRALFMDRVDQVIQRRLRDLSLSCAVLFLDLDRFKLVNDSFSHAVGDQLLVAVARRIAGALRPGDTVARIGGDEFTVLLDGSVDEEGAVTVAERVQALLCDAFNVDGHELVVSVSIGIAVSGGHMGASELLRNADIAMYDAKRNGRARWAVFDESMYRRVVNRLTRETELRQAVEDGLLEIHYQPIVNLLDGSIRGLEALVRWPQGWSELAPLDFIPIAEETGVIGALGMHVMRTALKRMAAWRSGGLIAEDVPISVNISSRQLEDPTLPGQIRTALLTAGMQPDSLRLEITESTLIHDPDGMQRIIAEVCATGVGLHLDDFGTGYSSLAALHQFPVDALKIDRSFVSSIDSGDDGSIAIVRSTVALAHSLGLQVIAEGIENRQQLRRLRALGCEHGQGFLFSEAVSAERTEMLLTGWSSARAVAPDGRLTRA